LYRNGDRRLSFAALLALLLVAVTLAACGTPRPVAGFLAPVTAPAPGASEHTVLVATTRQRDETPGTMFNGERSFTLNYAELTISVPPNHTPGKVEFAQTAPGNPNTDFVVRDAEYLDGDKQFVQALNAQLAERPRGERNVFIYVHGFNTLFAEAAYTAAQLVNDSHAPAVPVLFTWASRGQPLQYVYDTNSATTARDNLVHMLQLVASSHAEKVNILAHSMGNWVTVEALRQIKIAGKFKDVSKVGLVVLAAPDLDMDVFKSELRGFGKIQKPFYVVLSRDDKALGLSNFIAGGQSRVGNATDTAELTQLGATVIDLTDVKSMDDANHGKFMQLAEVGPQLQTLLASGIQTRASPSGASTATSSLITILGAPVKIIAAPIQAISNQ
jgi:esterase/lipase superfamily enzyme